MPDTPQPDFGTTELDPDLLSTPFRVQTNWHVITGAPCCGKTTLIDRLAKRGFQTVPEGARTCIEGEMAKGATIHPILEDAAALQRRIKDTQLRVERGLRPVELAFLDGALPASLAWYRAFGLNPNDILLECFQHQYASVFILDPLPFQSDEQRVEEVAAITGYLDKWLDRDFSALGYDVVRVPVLSPKERLAFVLDRLSEGGLV